MDHTGERVNPQFCKGNIEDFIIYLIHKKSYDQLFDEVKGKVVLDFGCGIGYGTSMLAPYAEKVVGIDIDPEAIAEARSNYHVDNIEYQCVEPDTDIASVFGTETFDAVISFQVIEHIVHAEEYLTHIKAVLKPNGKYFLTTPNAAIRLLPFQRPWNQFHVKEYTPMKLTTLLKKYFNQVHVQGINATQRVLAIEIKRTNRNKWLLWPFTNYLIPRNIQKKCLILIKHFIKKNGPENNAQVKTHPLMHTLSTDDFMIEDQNVSRCPDLFVTCHND